MGIFFLLKKQTGGTSACIAIVIRRLSDMQRQRRRRRCTLHCIAKKDGGVNLQQRRRRMKWVIHLVVCYRTVLAFEASARLCEVSHVDRRSRGAGTRNQAVTIKLRTDSMYYYCNHANLPVRRDARFPLILEPVSQTYFSDWTLKSWLCNLQVSLFIT